MGIEAIYRRKNTSKPHPDHTVFRYLLRKLVIDRPNQVWAADISYIPMARGFLYLIAIIDWFSRKVLAWRLSNSMAADFCVEALEEALARFGTPEIFNTDQGAQPGFNWLSQRSLGHILLQNSSQQWSLTRMRQKAALDRCEKFVTLVRARSR
jgi:putative transposase